ncbi:MAG: hypothetical protein K8W52_23955 [Deltaproteobacteria bacterium]|nr:hypothetical protein [Deltaproteobacteria bacterium]
MTDLPTLVTERGQGLRPAQLRVVMADGLEHRFAMDRIDEWPAPLRALVARRRPSISVWRARLQVS